MDIPTCEHGKKVIVPWCLDCEISSLHSEIESLRAQLAAQTERVSSLETWMEIRGKELDRFRTALETIATPMQRHDGFTSKRMQNIADDALQARQEYSQSSASAEAVDGGVPGALPGSPDIGGSLKPAVEQSEPANRPRLLVWACGKDHGTWLMPHAAAVICPCGIYARTEETKPEDSPGMETFTVPPVEVDGCQHAFDSYQVGSRVEISCKKCGERR